MRSMLKGALLPLVMSWTVLTYAEPHAPAVGAEFEAYLDGLVAAQSADYRLAGLSLSMVRDGKVVFKKGYGYADLETATAVDPDRHLFRPGSVSKLFTWTSVMQLVEQGKLDLNTDVVTHMLSC